METGFGIRYSGFAEKPVFDIGDSGFALDRDSREPASLCTFESRIPLFNSRTAGHPESRTQP
jgi:hypothetical protein